MCHSVSERSIHEVRGRRIGALGRDHQCHLVATIGVAGRRLGLLLRLKAGAADVA